MPQNDLVENIDEELVNPTDKRIFAISTAFHRGYSVDKIWQMTNIDKWFLTKLQYIFNMEQRLSYVIVIFFFLFQWSSLYRQRLQRFDHSACSSQAS